VKIDKTTCWYNKECCKNALEYAKTHPLEKTRHFQVLKSLLEIIIRDNAGKKLKLLDIGCGASSLQNTKIIKNNFYYTGSDFELMIQDGATKFNENGNYIICDIVESTEKELEFIKSYDVLVMNAFIDVMQYPIEILTKILSCGNKYVIIHRQRTTNDKTYSVTNPSYGGQTLCSILNQDDFLNVISNHQFIVMQKKNSKVAEDSYSFLLKK